MNPLVEPHAKLRECDAPSLSDDGTATEIDKLAPAETDPAHVACVGTLAEATTPAFENTVPKFRFDVVASVSWPSTWIDAVAVALLLEPCAASGAQTIATAMSTAENVFITRSFIMGGNGRQEERRRGELRAEGQSRGCLMECPRDL